MTPQKNSALPPGTMRHWLLGTGLAQVKNPLELLVRGHRRHGDVVYFRMFEGPTWLLCHPDHAQHVLADNARNYRHAGDNGGEGVPGPLLGLGLFASRGEFWRRQRRMVQPAFHRSRLALMVEGMVQGTQVLAERWEPRSRTGEPVELLGQMRHLVISLLGRSTFSRDVYESHTPLREAIDFFTEDSHGPRDSAVKAVMDILELRRSRRERFFAAIEKMNGVLYSIIAERRQSPAGWDDVLSMLMEAKDPQGEAMTDTQVRDELVSLFVGGQESTAVALTWTWYALARHPEVQRRVRDELTAVLGGRPPTAEGIQALRYTRAVVEEVIRLHPPAWQITRQAAQEDQLSGWTIPAGTLVLMSPYILHRHPSVWEQPEQFIPERFLPEQKERRHRYAYLPFGGGQRLCIGNGYTLTLIVTAIATLLQRYEVRVAPGHPLVTIAGSTYRPRNGIKATLHPAPSAT